DTLALAAGEADAVLANQGIITSRQLSNKPVGGGCPRRCLDLGRRGAEPSIGDVGADRVVEQADSCATSAIAPRNEASVTERISCPSIAMLPSSTSKNRGIRLSIVDFPAPDGPTSATVRPAGTVSKTPSSATAPGA